MGSTLENGLRWGESSDLEKWLMVKRGFADLFSSKRCHKSGGRTVGKQAEGGAAR